MFVAIFFDKRKKVFSGDWLCSFITLMKLKLRSNKWMVPTVFES